jgi:hypothetical protein
MDAPVRTEVLVRLEVLVRMVLLPQRWLGRQRWPLVRFVLPPKWVPPGTRMPAPGTKLRPQKIGLPVRSPKGPRWVQQQRMPRPGHWIAVERSKVGQHSKLGEHSRGPLQQMSVRLLQMLVRLPHWSAQLHLMSEEFDGDCL